MAQAGLHGLVGMALRRAGGERPLFPLGLILGSLLPDVDNFAVGVATLAGWPTDGLHRTLTHSLFFALAVLVVGYAAARWAQRPLWRHFSSGLAVGVLLHIALDILIWFNGVYLLWPLPLWVSPWQNVTPPAWWMQLMLPAEFLMFALFFGWLLFTAQRQGTDADYLPRLRLWTAVQAALFLIFLVLTYTWDGFFVPYGALYLLSLLLAFSVCLRLRATIEAAIR